MIRRLALASILTIASATALSPIAHAGDANVGFTGEVLKECTVVKALDGTLAGNLPSLPTQLITQQEGAVTATCNSYGNVSHTISQISGPSLAYKTSPVKVGSVGGDGTPTSIPVSLTADNGGTILPAGNYAFDVTVTVTP